MQRFVILACVLSAGLAVGADRDDGQCQPIKSRLFGTKTLYEDARRAIKLLDKDDKLPKPFDDDSLEEEHKDLLKDDCQPVALYFMGRHSARFPDGQDIDQYNKDLSALVGRLNSSSSPPGEGCRASQEEVKRWTPKMQTKHDNLITELGGREERDIARRFKRLYPEFFDGRKTDIKIGVTSKFRTAQTASEFLKEVEGLDLDSSCGKIPTNDLAQPQYSLDKVLEATCYKYLTDKFEAPFLEFHTQCKKISGGEKIRDPLIDRVKDPKLKRRMAERIGRKLGLRGSEDALTAGQLDSIWNMCKFENAMQNSSVWCNLFERKDIEMLEYIEDTNTYIKSAYGPNANVRQSCPVVGNLIESFQEVIKMHQENRNGSNRKRAFFYFSHADPIKKLLAAFGMFKDDESYTPSRVEDFETDLKVPKRRSWRSSLVSPFSANLAFILYKCPKSNNRDKFKVLATVTEQPVKLGGCKSTDCNIQRFMEAYEGMRQCDLNKICRKI